MANPALENAKISQKFPRGLLGFSDFPPHVAIQTQVGDADATQNGRRRKPAEADGSWRKQKIT